jgi:hypothetical protein
MKSLSVGSVYSIGVGVGAVAEIEIDNFSRLIVLARFGVYVVISVEGITRLPGSIPTRSRLIRSYLDLIGIPFPGQDAYPEIVFPVGEFRVPLRVKGRTLQVLP